MANERTRVLPLDRNLAEMFRKNTVEDSLQVSMPKTATGRHQQSHSLRKSTENHLGRMSNMQERRNGGGENTQATMDTILRRNNSITVVKRAIPYAHLHKKTYFNALEKILISQDLKLDIGKAKQLDSRPVDNNKYNAVTSSMPRTIRD